MIHEQLHTLWGDHDVNLDTEFVYEINAISLLFADALCMKNFLGEVMYTLSALLWFPV